MESFNRRLDRSSTDVSPRTEVVHAATRKVWFEQVLDAPTTIERNQSGHMRVNTNMRFNGIVRVAVWVRSDADY